MPHKLSHATRWPTSLIIIAALSAVIICSFAVLLLYLRGRKRQDTSAKVSNSPTRLLGQVTTACVPPTSPVGIQAGFGYVGINTAERLPRLEPNEVLIDSAHPSVYNTSDSPSRLKFDNRSSDLVRLRLASKHQIGLPPTKKKSHSVSLEGKTTQNEIKLCHRRLNSQGDTLGGLGLPEIIQLPHRGLLESSEQPKKINQVYSTINEQGSTFSSLLEVSPGKLDAPLPSADSSAEFGGSAISKAHLDRFPEVRIVPSAIVQTTEKKTATQILRRKLLSFISVPANPVCSNYSGENEVKYYWEMMQVESNDAWWELPYPPRLSPIKADFEVPSPDFDQDHKPHSQECRDHTGINFDPTSVRNPTTNPSGNHAAVD